MAEVWTQLEGQAVNEQFHLGRYLGGTDSSAVFLTELTEAPTREAAIKLTPVDPRSVEIQLSRWRLAAELSHPHLIEILQMGSSRLDDTDVLYIVTEYAEEDLSQIIPDRPLAPVEARAMLESVLDALAFLHAKGFAHGRVKPSNIMAIGDQIKLSIDGVGRIGESSSVGGRPSLYDPPEAARSGMSAAADIWALGMTLVETLTQRLPVWERMGEGDPFLPEALPEPFLGIARHCLRRDPQLRSTVGEIAARLQPVSSLLGQQSSDRSRKGFNVPRYMVPVAAIALALVAIFAVPRFLDRHPKPEQAAIVTSHQEEAQQARDQESSTSQARKSIGRTANPAKGRSVAASSIAAIPTGSTPKSTANTVHGEVADQVLPDVPQKALDTIRGTVRVSVGVHVDSSGSVAAADFMSVGPSKYFADLAMQAARQWIFDPPTVDGREVPSEWVLRFEFTTTGTKAVPTQTSP